MLDYVSCHQKCAMNNERAFILASCLSKFRQQHLRCNISEDQAFAWYHISLGTSYIFACILRNIPTKYNAFCLSPQETEIQAITIIIFKIIFLYCLDFQPLVSFSHSNYTAESNNFSPRKNYYV